MDQSRRPDQKERPAFEGGAVYLEAANVGRQRAIGDEEAKRGEDQTAAAANTDRVQQVRAGMPVPLMSGAAGAGPEQQAGGDHYPAGQPAQKIQPAQRPVFELNEMQAAEESLDGGHRPGPVIEQEGSTAAVKGHAIDVHGHLAGKARSEEHT